MYHIFWKRQYNRLSTQMWLDDFPSNSYNSPSLKIKMLIEEKNWYKWTYWTVVLIKVLLKQTKTQNMILKFLMKWKMWNSEYECILHLNTARYIYEISFCNKAFSLLWKLIWNNMKDCHFLITFFLKARILMDATFI